MNSGQRFFKFFKGKTWEYAKNDPVRVVGYAIGGIILSSSPFVFSFERLLLKSRIHFGFFVPQDEKFEDGKFKETSSSKLLREILSPEVEANSYYMITGEHGIGKSSAATHGADMLGHSGVVYIKVPHSGDPKEFEESLAQRLFLHHLVYDKFFSFISLFTGMILLDFPRYDGEKRASYLTILMKKLCVLSNQYKRWHGDKGLVLVIDQVSHFLKNKEEGMKYLEILQDIAKDLADSKKVKIVFISEGEAFARMVNRSAISRAHVVEFQEASEAEAFNFLEERLNKVKFNEKQNELDDLVKNYTGGKFKALMDVAKGVDDLQEKKKQLRVEAEGKLIEFGMLRGNEELEKQIKDASLEKEERKKAKKALVMKDIGNHIVNNGNMDRKLVSSKIGGTMGEEELRRTNVFAYHHSTISYSFATRGLKTVYQASNHSVISVLQLLFHCCLGDGDTKRQKSTTA